MSKLSNLDILVDSLILRSKMFRWYCGIMKVKFAGCDMHIEKSEDQWAVVFETWSWERPTKNSKMSSWWGALVLLVCLSWVG